MPIGLRCRRAGQTAFSLFKFAEGADYTVGGRICQVLFKFIGN